jgi:hypothetical protein
MSDTIMAHLPTKSSKRTTKPDLRSAVIGRVKQWLL